MALMRMLLSRRVYVMSLMSLSLMTLLLQLPPTTRAFGGHPLPHSSRYTCFHGRSGLMVPTVPQPQPHQHQRQRPQRPQHRYDAIVRMTSWADEDRARKRNRLSRIVSGIFGTQSKAQAKPTSTFRLKRKSNQSSSSKGVVDNNNLKNSPNAVAELTSIGLMEEVSASASDANTDVNTTDANTNATTTTNATRNESVERNVSSLEMTTSDLMTATAIPASANVLGDASSFSVAASASATTDTLSKEATETSRSRRRGGLWNNAFGFLSRKPDKDPPPPPLDDAVNDDVKDVTVVVGTVRNKKQPSKKQKQKPLLLRRFQLMKKYALLGLVLMVAAPVPKRLGLEEEYNDASTSLSSSSPPPQTLVQQQQQQQQTPSNSNDRANGPETTDQDDKFTSPNVIKDPHARLFASSTEKDHDKKSVAVVPPSSSSRAASLPVPSTSFVATAVKKIGPSVVRVDTEIYAEEQGLFLNPFFSPSDDADPPQDKVIRSGQGSGIIFSRDGLVLTNAHVVDGANRVYVTLTDGRKYVAEVAGTDEMVDLAVLRILLPNGDNNSNSHSNSNSNNNVVSSEQLPVGNLGDSDHVCVGEFVIAVGNPGGLDNTVTMGIISSLKRSSEEVGLPSKKVTFIQTDAAVNPGNSGGPLVNEHGEIIGITTCIRANMEGIAFAIPINKAKEIMHPLARGEHIPHGYIGVVMMTITPDFARQNNLDRNSPVGLLPEIHGVLVERVFADTPASVPDGLRKNDVVKTIGGVAVRNAGEAARVVDSAPVGTPLEIAIVRGGEERTVTLRPDDLAQKMRQRKERIQKMRQQQQPHPQSQRIPVPFGGFGGSGGNYDHPNGGDNGPSPGRIFILPFP